MAREVLRFRPAHACIGIAETFAAERERIERLLPHAEVVHTGASSVSNALTRGDLDIQVRVEPAAFAPSRETLERHYDAYRPEIWNESFVAFVSPGAPIPTGLVLTAVGAEHDRLFLATWDRLRGEPRLVAALNALKAAFEGSSDADSYEQAKAEFFAAL